MLERCKPRYLACKGRATLAANGAGVDMGAINRRDDWMGLAGFKPTFCHGAEGLEKQCVLANRVVSGYPLNHVLVAFNRWDSEWEMMPPVLIGANGHWVAIVNTKLDESGIRACHMVDERGERKQLRFDEDGRLFRQRMQGALAWEKERILRRERGVRFGSMLDETTA